MITGWEFTMQDVAPTFGYFGAGVYLIAYTLLQTGVLRGQGYTYASMVIIAASCVGISAIGTLNPAVLTIQLFYIAISILGIIRLFVMSHMLRCSPEERAFVRTHLPDLKAENVRPLLRRGQWIEIEAGQVLAQQGQPVDHLYFLHQGTAKVTVDGRIVGTCHDCFVGELTALTGEAATATVVADSDCRVLAFESSALRKLLRRKSDIKLALIGGLTQATKMLLLRRNREAHQTPAPDQ